MWDVRCGIAECGVWIADLKKHRAEGIEHREEYFEFRIANCECKNKESGIRSQQKRDIPFFIFYSGF